MISDLFCSPDGELLPSMDTLDSDSTVLSAIGISAVSTAFVRFRQLRQVSSRIKLLNSISEYYSNHMPVIIAEMRDDPTHLSAFYDGSYPVNDCYSRFQSILDSIESELRYLADLGTRLDILNTIDQPSVWSRECREYFLAYPASLCVSRYAYPVRPGLKDAASEMLRIMTYNSRKVLYTQRFINAILRAHSRGWYIVFDTLTFDNTKVDAFNDSPTALRDYFRSIGRSVLEAERRPVSGPYSDCFEYACVPEYGTEKGRLHFHVILLLRTLPLGSRDPNVQSRSLFNREINRFRSFWSYGKTSPVAVRYTGDAYTRLGWFWPRDKRTGQALKSRPPIAVAYYVTKYVSKFTNQSKIRTAPTGGSSCQVRSALLQLHSQEFRLRTSRLFGTQLPSMCRLSTPALLQIMRLNYSVSPMTALLKRVAKKQLALRMANRSYLDIMASAPVPTSLLQSLRNLIRSTPESSLPNFGDILTPSLSREDISDEVATYLSDGQLYPECFRTSPTTFASK